MKRLGSLVFTPLLRCCAAASILFLVVVAPLRAEYVRDDFNGDWPYDATGIVPPDSIWAGGYNFGAGGPHDSNITNPGALTMGLNAVGVEAEGVTGPLQFVNIDAAVPFSARVKISTQANGFWSLAGLIVRKPQALGSGAERHVQSTSFRPGGDGFGTGWAYQSTGWNGTSEQEVNAAVTVEEALSHLRVDNLGGGSFQMYSSSDGLVWINRGVQTVAELATGPLEVGLYAGAIGDLPDATVAYDWFEVYMVPEPATLTLAGLAIAMGIASRRRRRFPVST